MAPEEGSGSADQKDAARANYENLLKLMRTTTVSAAQQEALARNATLEFDSDNPEHRTVFRIALDTVGMADMLLKVLFSKFVEKPEPLAHVRMSDLIALFDLLWEFLRSTGRLMSAREFSSACALARASQEAAYRLIWLDRCADDHAADLWRQNRGPKIDRMITAIEASGAFPAGSIRKSYAANEKTLHGFAHSTFRLVGRRGYHGARYKLGDLVTVMDHAVTHAMWAAEAITIRSEWHEGRTLISEFGRSRGFKMRTESGEPAARKNPS